MSVVDRPTLSRELIAETALRLTDEAGLSGLSMRKLGGELGVEAMSLYHYVKNKDDLLDAVLDRLYAEVELPVDDPAADWEATVRVGLRSLHNVLLRHPAALELFSSRPAPSTDSVLVLYWAYEQFRKAGLDEVGAHHAFRFAVSWVMGFGASEIGALGRATDDEVPDFAHITDPDLKAFVARNAQFSVAETFDAGLDSVVAGLRAGFNLP